MTKANESVRGFEAVAAAAAASRLLRDFTKKKNITLVFSRLLFVSFARRLGIRAFLILAPEISGCERSVVESARDREKGATVGSTNGAARPTALSSRTSRLNTQDPR